MADQLWTLTSVSKYWADHKPDAEAYIFLNKHGERRVLTARDAFIMAGRFANRLRQCGFTSGDVIANAIPNSPERVVSDLGILMAGCIILNCQILERDGGDFWNTANVSKCKGVLLPQGTPSNAAFQLLSPFILGNSTGILGYRDISLPKAPLLHKAFIFGRKNTKIIPKDTDEVSSGDASNLQNGSNKENHSEPQTDANHNVQNKDAKKQNGGVSGDHSRNQDQEDVLCLDNLRTSDENILMEECSPSDDAYVFLTSGSTGFSKLVPRNHKELLRMARGLDRSGSNYFNDRHLGWLGGFSFDYYGSCMPRLLQDTFTGEEAQNVQEIWNLLEREKCDGALFTTSTLMELLEIFNGEPPKFKLSYIFAAGEALRKGAVAAVGFLTDTLINMYASTETGVIALYPVSDPSDFKDFACGYPLKHVQIKIVDDKLQELTPGQEGNVLVKSKSMFRHYYNYEPPKPVFTPDGWFMIQDRGLVDEKGLLYVQCRQGDVISQGPFLVYLSWPEAVINKCPDVTHSSVVAVKDKNGEDRLCACVSVEKGSSLTEEGLVQFYNDNYFAVTDTAKMLKPELKYVLFYDIIPLNANGKLDKKKMKEDAAKKYKLP